MKRILYSLLCLCACLSLHAEVKYVFYFIGDGMGSAHVLASEMYLAELDGKLGRNQLFMTGLPYSGELATYSASNGITDSSAAGTALATGSKANSGTLGITPQGDTLTTIAEQLKREGWAVGLLTTVAIDHATPAAFYAKSASRDSYYEIGRQLTRTGFDFFGGAGFHEPNSDKQPNLYDLAEQEGYTVAGGLKAAINASKDAKKLILVQPEDAADRNRKGGNFAYMIDDRPFDLHLKPLTEFAIEYLESRGDRFFLMVEGGMIDYACHGEDGATAIKETIDFDAAVGKALEFYNRHPMETLIVVTADHETGGMALGHDKYVLDLQLLQHQHCSSWVLSDELTALYSNHRQPEWEEVKKLLQEKLDFYTDVTISEQEDEELQRVFRKTIDERDESEVKTLYKDINALCNAAIGLLNRKAQLGWVKYGHTGGMVPIFAIGKGAEQFTGWQDNTAVAPRILNIVHGK